MTHLELPPARPRLLSAARRRSLLLEAGRALVHDLQLPIVAPAPRVALVVRVDAHDVVQVIGRQVEEIAGALDDLVRGHRRKVRELLP